MLVLPCDSFFDLFAIEMPCPGPVPDEKQERYKAYDIMLKLCYTTLLGSLKAAGV